MKRFRIFLLGLAIVSSTLCTTSLLAQNDKRLQDLQKEKDKLKRQGSDPVGYTKTQIKISEILLSLASDSVRSGDLETMGERLDGYVTAIEDALQMMISTGRDAHRKPGGFKDLEIALRRQVRQLQDIGDALTFDVREPVDKAKDRASDIRDELLRALFGEQNAPSRKS